MSIPDEVLMKSKLIHDWVEDNIGYYKLQHPNAKESQIREILTDIAKKHINNLPCYLHNDYQDDRRVQADLLTLYDWYYKNRPIAAGYGTFFFNQDSKSSPLQGIIDGRIAARKEAQHVRDQYIADTSSYEYRYFDMMQNEAKIKINAIYGSFGAKTFQLYNVYTAACTTATAQSLISTTAMSFEAFLNNAVKFRSLGELVTMVGNILLKDKHELSIDGLEPITNPNMVYNLWKGMFTEWNERYSSTMKGLLRFRTTEELTRLYYNNNLFQFIENNIIFSKLMRIFDVTTEFRNPNNVPENIQDDLDFIWRYCREFVFYNHAYTEQINRLKNDKRTRVILIDTDSNVINIKPWVDWTEQKIWRISSTVMNDEDKRFCSVNTIAYLVTRMARELLDRYADDCNILPRFRQRLNTKNEFYFSKVLLANVKKRYIAAIKLKEGKQVRKIELKGHDFKKAGVNASIEEELMGIIKRDIIDAPLVDVVALMRDTVALEKKIRTSIMNRERTYLIRMNCKVARSYKSPYSQGAFTGPLLWNFINPNNTILIPDKCDVVFLNIPSEKVLMEKLGTKFPNEAEIIRREMFQSPIRELRESCQSKGVTYLALPNDNTPIPEWVYPVLDIERLVTRNTGTFYPVLKALSFITINTGNTGSGGNEYSSNILNV